MDDALASLPLRRRNEDWLDLGFRVAIVVLAGFWLLTTPTKGDLPEPGAGAMAQRR